MLGTLDGMAHRGLNAARWRLAVVSRGRHEFQGDLLSRPLPQTEMTRRLQTGAGLGFCAPGLLRLS